MLKRDYILKMIQELFAALERLLHNDNRQLTERQRDVEALYTILGHDAQFFRSSTEQEILESLTVFDDDYLQRVNMLAEIMYADAKLFVGNYEVRHDIIAKALSLYTYVDERSDDFSITRIERIDELNKLLAQYQY